MLAFPFFSNPNYTDKITNNTVFLTQQAQQQIPSLISLMRFLKFCHRTRPSLNFIIQFPFYIASCNVGYLFVTILVMDESLDAFPSNKFQKTTIHIVSEKQTLVFDMKVSLGTFEL